MAKVNNKHGKPGQSGKNSVKRRQHSQVLPQKNKQEQKKPVKPKQGSGEPVQANQRPQVPFSKKDRVLLIGEGDFSFALSLVKHHRIQSLTATSYDSEAELVQKYPKVKQTIAQILALSSSPPADPVASQDSASFEGFSPPPQPPSPDITPSSQPTHRPTVTIFYSIDATRLSTTKLLRPHLPFTKIVFNFPHTGGLSTDVNRQVRANQQLLVSFFESAKPLLLSSIQQHTPSSQPHSQRSERYDTPSSSSDEDPTSESLPGVPQILTTLFTTPPYTLWNIRDLARHAGYSISTSFRFPWLSYPGYTHARTLGEITSGKDRSGEGKRKGAWRGEEREARTYVLELREGADGGDHDGGRRFGVAGGGKGARHHGRGGGGVDGRGGTAGTGANEEPVGERGAKKRKRETVAESSDSE